MYFILYSILFGGIANLFCLLFLNDIQINSNIKYLYNTTIYIYSSTLIGFGYGLNYDVQKKLNEQNYNYLT
jgi:hypothetical protein